MAPGIGGQDEPPPSRLKIAAVVGFYIVAAIMMITVNKWVLISSPTPIFLLLIQLLIAVILLYILHRARLLPLPLPLIHKPTAKSLSKLILINVLGLLFNTFCLQYVEASFYQIARGLVLPITIGVAVVVGEGVPSGRAGFCCALVTVGFLVGVSGDGRVMGVVGGGGGKGEAPSLIGITFGILSSITTAIHSIIIKQSLPLVDNSAIALAWYSNLLSAGVLLFLVPFEWRKILEMVGDGERLRTFVLGSFVTGVFGFLICVAAFLSIKLTSPVTHMVSVAARGAIQTYLGVWLFHDALPRTRISSLIIITLASCTYVWVKDQEQKEKLADKEHITAHDYELAGLDEEDDQTGDDVGVGRRSLMGGDRHRQSLHRERSDV